MKMIKLFQQKADNALEALAALRRQPKEIQQDFDQTSTALVLKAQAEVWQKAADLLRKEELSK